MKRRAMAGLVSALCLFGMSAHQAQAISPVNTVEYVGANGGQWSDANAWKNLNTNTTGNANTILGRNNGSNGMNTTSLNTTHARHIIIDDGNVVNYHGNSIGDLRMNQGSDLTIKEGAVWQQVTDGTFTENSWTQFDGELTLDNGTFRRSVAAPSQMNDGGGILMFGSFRDDEAFEEIGGPAKIKVNIKNGGLLENNGQLWFGADDEHSLGLRASININNGSLNLTGGTVPQTNSTLTVAADLAFFYDYYRDAVFDPSNTDPNGRPKNEEYAINFTGSGSITVDSAGIWVYRQDEFGVWDEGSAGPLSYQDLWNQGILTAHGLSGKSGVTVPSSINDNNRVRQAANFNEFFTVTGTPGSNDYTLTSITPNLQKVEYVGANGGQWSDANAWKNVTTNTTGNANTILGRNNGSNGMNTVSMATTHARDVTIPAGVTVNYHGNSIGDLRWNQGSILTIEQGAVWQQVTNGTFTENSWTQFDGQLVLNGGIFRRSVAAPSQMNDGGGILMFGSFRDDEAFEEIGGPAKIIVDIKKGGRLENNGQLWFGADDEHSLGLRVNMTINDGHLDLTGGTVPQTNSTLTVAADLAFFYDYYRDAVFDPTNTDPNGRPKAEEYQINFTGPGSITVDSAGIWVYRQDEFGVWDEGNAGPLSYQDLWNQGILTAFGLSGKAGEIVPSSINDANRVRQAANFNDYFSVTGTPGSNDYILTSLITTFEVPPDGDADYNEDGVIDAADYVLWRKNPSSFGGNPSGYDAWRQTFGSASPGAGSGGAVPEPSTVLMMLIGLVGAAAFKRNSR